MANSDDRVDLIQRAAERLKAKEGSLVEAAMARAARAEPPSALADAAAAPAPLPPVGGARTSRHVDIDLQRLRLRGAVTPKSAPAQLGEEYRILKRQVLALAFDPARRVPRGNVVMITSSRPAEGKTFTAVNLAMSMAAEPGLHVLLINADLHRNGIDEMLGIRTEHGLVDLLTNSTKDFGDVLLRTNVPNLSYIPSGPRIENASEMMASRQMGALVEEVSTRYPDQIVIIDTPPALAISDPSVISSHVGQVLMVVEAGATSMKAIEQALGLITGCEHVSFVLNKTSFTAGSNQFGSYSYYKAEHP